MNIKEITQHYQEQAPLYKRLASNLNSALDGFLTTANVEYFEIENRVKTIESILNKTERKIYQSPFDDIADFCGLRIITYYLSDLEIISTILKNEFEVIEIIDKQEEMEEDRFGYRSFHFIGKLKESWLHAPNYRGLGNLQFEIQFRTVLMHGWAAISHKLAYKHEKDIPKRFRRDLFRMSALIELADEQFERLRIEREEYTKEIISDNDEGKKLINTSESLNLDILKKILDVYFPNRKESESSLSELLKELNDNNINTELLINNIELVLPHLEEIEKDEIENAIGYGDIESDTQLPMWEKAGVLRTVLDLTVEQYSNNRPEYIAETLSKWQPIIDQKR